MSLATKPGDKKKRQATKRATKPGDKKKTPSDKTGRQKKRRPATKLGDKTGKACFATKPENRVAIPAHPRAIWSVPGPCPSPRFWCKKRGTLHGPSPRASPRAGARTAGTRRQFAAQFCRRHPPNPPSQTGARTPQFAAPTRRPHPQPAAPVRRPNPPNPPLPPWGQGGGV